MSDIIHFSKPTYTELLQTFEMGKRQLSQCMTEWGDVCGDDIETQQFFFRRGNCEFLDNYMVVAKNDKDLTGWDGVMGTSLWGGDVVKLYEDRSGSEMVKVCSFYYGSES